MPDREDDISLSRGTLYCELHERYYRADTGCLLCHLVRGENYRPEPVKDEKMDNAAVKTDRCHYCGKDSLAWNPAINMYECCNSACKRRISRFTKMGLGELLDDAPTEEIPSISEEDARAVTRNFAVNPKRYRQVVDEDTEYGMDVALPCDTELAGYSGKVKQDDKSRVAAVKSALILLSFICFGFAIWAVMLLATAGVSQVAGIIILAAVFGALIWSVYGITCYKSVGLGFILLFLFITATGFALCAAAGIEPFSSIGNDMIQFFG